MQNKNALHLKYFNLTNITFKIFFYDCSFLLCLCDNIHSSNVYTVYPSRGLVPTAGSHWAGSCNSISNMMYSFKVNQ